MKRILTVIALSLGVVYGGDLRAEEEPPPTTHNAAAYYGWLDKFENPSDRPTTPTQQNGTETRIGKGRTAQPDIAAVNRHPSTEGENGAVSDAIDGEQTAEPGEGLGCYYHRAYYSHLPMFKDEVYSLRGSLDVAETFHKPSEDVVSVPSLVTPTE